MRSCVREDEIYDILHACHDEPCGGHFVGKITSLKILTTRYYWPTLHKDAMKYTSNFEKCQRMGQPTKTDEMPLTPQVVVTTFDKLGMEFIVSIDPPSSGKSYTLVCIDYVTKCVEVRVMKNARDEKVSKFLYEEIFTCY